MLMASAAHTKLLSAKPTCALLFAAWVYAFWPAIHISFIAYTKSSFDYHGLLILPMILLFISKNNSNLNRAALIYNPFGLALLLSSMLLWLFAEISELNILGNIAIITMLLSIIITTCGKKVTHIILLPLLCLYLLLPIGNNIFKITTQWFSTSMIKALSASNISVYWETQQIYVNNNSYDILSYLGSFKYVMLYITLGCSFALVRTKNLLTFIAIASSFAIMPLLTLWLTLYSFILFNNIWHPVNLSQHSIIIIGWLCAILGLGHAITLSILIGDKSHRLRVSGDIDWHASYTNAKFNWLPPLVMASSIILMAPIVGENLDNSKHYSSIDHLLSQTDELSEWDGPKVQYSFTNHEIYIDKTWTQIKQSSRKVKINNKVLKVQENILRSHNKQYKIVWTTNYVNGHLINNNRLAKALSKIYTLTPKGTRAGIVTISTQVKSDLNGGRNTLKGYMQKISASKHTPWLK